jgi:hypothetical protein
MRVERSNGRIASCTWATQTNTYKIHILGRCLPVLLFTTTSQCPSRAWQIRECILVRAVRTCMFSPNLERIRSEMSERLIKRKRALALAHTLSHAVLEHVKYVSHVTCGHL